MRGAVGLGRSAALGDIWCGVCAERTQGSAAAATGASEPFDGAVGRKGALPGVVLPEAGKRDTQRAHAAGVDASESELCARVSGTERGQEVKEENPAALATRVRHAGQLR